MLNDVRIKFSRTLNNAPTLIYVRFFDFFGNPTLKKSSRARNAQGENCKKLKEAQEKLHLEFYILLEIPFMRVDFFPFLILHIFKRRIKLSRIIQTYLLRSFPN